ncbi:hypothetical protein HMPREF1044_0466 [Streptococcus constellatus subsp. constellatus SK53]|uniref:Uncharacterized protein n=1 Tax=Streptococcus constellatus subsp. constellatus SK53 TaxID=1095730 RepID=A0AAD2SVE3_STRCV|nr:hypothetical protein HMPREF1044_0466 [Streptococcus constellatus subsp. constellatus SK53]
MLFVSLINIIFGTIYGIFAGSLSIIGLFVATIFFWEKLAINRL